MFDGASDGFSGLTAGEQLKGLLQGATIQRAWELPIGEHPAESFAAGAIAPVVARAVAAVRALGRGTDLCELCGGEARASQIPSRRRLKTGDNSDL
eukprot:7959483-Pyramimonas_sp.AAC.1